MKTYKRKRESWKTKRADTTNMNAEERNWHTQRTGKKRWNLWNPCQWMNHHFKSAMTHSHYSTWVRFWWLPWTRFEFLIQVRADVHIKQFKIQTCTLGQLKQTKKLNLTCDIEWSCVLVKGQKLPRPRLPSYTGLFNSKSQCLGIAVRTAKEKFKPDACVNRHLG